MSKNLLPKIILILVLVALAAWTLYPPNKTLKPGIDLAGGTSLIYEISTEGLKPEETKDLAQRMITILRRRIDPANIQNLVWRPQGNIRFEIQMPLASAATRAKRQNFEDIRDALLGENVSPATVISRLEKPADERAKDFERFAHGDPNRLKILENLTTAYDERKQLQDKRDQLDGKLKDTEEKISSAGLDLDQIKLSVKDWTKLPDPNLQESLEAFLGSETHLDTLTDYTKTYAEWARVLQELTDPESGKNVKYEQARRELDKLNISEEQLNYVLEMPVKSPNRKEQIDELKTEFPDRAEKIDQVVVAFDAYRPDRGRLDDPEDLQRMLKGAGILEFRILPTQGHPDVDMAAMATYLESLREKGPKYASDDRYVWCEIENPETWDAIDDQRRPCLVGQFGDKHYVLASNKKDGKILHSAGEGQWKLEKAEPSTDRYGRRAIGFRVDDRGGRLFYNVSDKNIGRPLCILLDDLAISAPTIQTQLRTENQITGSFTQIEVTDMINKLNAGSLPARLIEQPIWEKTIGPAIGADNRDQGIRAGFIGLIVVMLCMVTYYTLAGSIADMALLMNILFVLAIMAGVRATFTLPGIAGIILTIGMSVDANVLIFERIREEQQKGSSLAIAIKNGYQRAFRAILDANVTTFITAAILYWVASEEIKGFAIVLMLGIASSMFTALVITRWFFSFILMGKLERSLRILVYVALIAFVVAAQFYLLAPTYSRALPGLPWAPIRILGLITLIGFAPVVFACLARAVIRLLLTQGILEEPLFMLRLIHEPKIDWMRARPVFLVVSAVLIIAGLTVFFTRDDAKNNKYDIEFTGGTSVQINLEEGVSLSRQDVQDTIRRVGIELNNPALAAANVTSVGKSGRSYEITTTATNRTTATVTFSASGQTDQPTVQSLAAAIETAQVKFDRKLSNLTVAPISQNEPSFAISTSQISPSLVKSVLTAAFPDADISEPQVDEVVNDAVTKAFANQLKIQQNLQPRITSKERVTQELIDAHPELIDFVDGIRINCALETPTTPQEIDQRIKDLRFKPDTRSLDWDVRYQIFGANVTPVDPNQPVQSFVYVSAGPEAGLRELTEDEWTRFVENETAKVTAAASSETSLPRVIQIDPSIGAEQKERALIAIALSLFAIVAYIWFRFGDVRYGLAAIIALVHDVCITLGAVTASVYIAASPIGEKLLIGDFKIDLAMIAAFLTLIGYSLNDTIVVFDRIRENRRKAQLVPQTITKSINQTISRTILTSFTTFIVVLMMYIFGGPRLRGFTFAIGLGVIIGTYSSIAIAAPVLLLRPVHYVGRLLGMESKSGQGK